MPKTEANPQTGVKMTPEGQDKNAQLMERIKKLEDESAKYRMQNTILESKLRGYQTLGQILQETKRELRKYKTQMAESPSPEADEKDNEKPDVKCQTMMESSVDSNDLYSAKNLSPRPSSTASVEAGPEEQTEGQTPTPETSNKEQVNSNSNTTEEKLSIACQPVGEVDQVESKKNVDKQTSETAGSSTDIKEDKTNKIEETGISSACLPPFHDTWDMSVESSVVEENFSMHSSDISESGASTAGSLSLPPFRSSSGSSIQIVSPPDSEMKLPEDNQQGIDEEVNVSVQVEDLSKMLCGAVGLDSKSDVAPRLTRIMVDVVRMEKQLENLQGLIDKLTAENENLKVKVHVTLPEKDRYIMELRNENDMLLKKVCKLERERDKMPPLRDSPSSEWVHVNMQQKQASSEDVQESSLQKKYQTAQEEVEQLTKVNEKWAKHIDALKADYEGQIESLKRELASCRSKLAEKEDQENRRQKDIDRIILTAKKRAEDAETEREDALNKLHLEGQRRRHEEQKVAALEGQIAQMEIHWPRSMPIASVEAQELTSLHSGGASASLDSLCRMSSDELRTEVQVLKQQILIYKDDFDTERRDREKAQDDLEATKLQLATLKKERLKEQKKVAEIIKDSERVKEDNTQLEVNLAMKQEEIAHLREELRRPFFPPTTYYEGQMSPTRNLPITSVMENWTCTRCTYSNVPQRTTCELCGKGKVMLGGWKCASCTYFNLADSSRCAICDQLPPARGSLVRPAPQVNIRYQGHRHLVSRQGEECDESQHYYGYTPMHESTNDLVTDMQPDTTPGKK